MAQAHDTDPSDQFDPSEPSPSTLIVDQPAISDPAQLDFALGVQALLVRALWDSHLYAVPASHTEPGHAGGLQILDEPRPLREFLDHLRARGQMFGHVLQLNMSLSDTGLALQARLHTRVNPEQDQTHLPECLAAKSYELMIEPESCSLYDALHMLVEFTLFHTADGCMQAFGPEIEQAADPCTVWGVDDPALLIAQLCVMGSSIRAMTTDTQAEGDPRGFGPGSTAGENTKRWLN